jgi:hypothetical protein
MRHAFLKRNTLNKKLKFSCFNKNICNKKIISFAAVNVLGAIYYNPQTLKRFDR